MGDVSTEPSMEDILSSIKRIIAEENDGAASARAARRPARRARELDEDEVLELSEPAPAEDSAIAAGATPVEAAAAAAPAPAGDEPAETILSDRAFAATRDSIEALSRIVVKPETPGSDTLEGLVREMLKPMLSAWLDANLPEIVERTVQREIARITRRD